MIAGVIPGWSRALRDGAVELVAPEGRHAGVITVRERVRPLVRLDELVAHWAGPDATIVAPPARLVTDEGEHGVVVAALGEGGRVRVELGVVVGDGCYRLVVGVVPADAALAARLGVEVRRLVERVPLLLGERRRLVPYARPAGWRGCPRGLDTLWYAPGVPDHPAKLTVFAALPARGATTLDAVAHLAGEASAAAPRLAEAAWEETTRRTPHGLVFVVRTAVAGDHAVHVAAASDGRYVYAAMLERRDDDLHRRVLDATLDSLVPVPAPASASSATSAGAFAHWAG